jgi:hypothetical protein
LPQAFCWSRAGHEAGQSLDAILRRKERERIANGGVFYWGIGNSVGPAIRELLRHEPHPEVIFSPIVSRARGVDATPSAIAAWTLAEPLDGTSFELPGTALVTSRLDPSSPKKIHYALVCFSEAPLVGEVSGERVEATQLENIVSGRPVGASQVTAVVRRRDSSPANSRPYPVMLRAWLVAPFFVRLRNPVVIPRQTGATEWQPAVEELWETRLARLESTPALQTQANLPTFPASR